MLQIPTSNFKNVDEEIRQDSCTCIRSLLTKINIVKFKADNQHCTVLD